VKSFKHITPPLRLFSGGDSLESLGHELERAGSRRAAVFCGKWAQGPLLDAVRNAMRERCAGVFTGVAAHSPLASVEAAAEELKRLEADAVVAVGGGSAIVTARAASILAAENGDVRALCTTRGADGQLRSPKLLAPKIPQFIVPTTPTTAMVKAGSAVFVPETGERLALFDPKTRAQAIFVHPDFILSAPRKLVISSGLNTFAMAIEGLMSRQGDPIADALLMHALRLLGPRLKNADTLDDAETRTSLVLGAALCGQGTDHTSAGITTVIGHAVGARYGIENGTVNGIVLPHVLRFNAEASRAGLSNIAAALGLPQNGEPLDAVIDAVETLKGAIGVPRRLRDVSVSRDALTDIADAAMGDWFLRGNPRPVQGVSELLQVLNEAW
jgi:alcohol dehydrogenase class IV